MDINLTTMDLDSLKTLCSNNLVVYTHGCKDAAKHHLGKYKHWAKLVTAVDTSKTNGYAFIGNFLQVTAEHKVPVGSVIVDVCDTDIDCYVMDASGKRKVYSGDTGRMSKFIDDVATLF